MEQMIANRRDELTRRLISLHEFYLSLGPDAAPMLSTPGLLEGLCEGFRLLGRMEEINATADRLHDYLKPPDCPTPPDFRTPCADSPAPASPYLNPIDIPTEG